MPFGSVNPIWFVELTARVPFRVTPQNVPRGSPTSENRTANAVWDQEIATWTDDPRTVTLPAGGVAIRPAGPPTE